MRKKHHIRVILVLFGASIILLLHALLDKIQDGEYKDKHASRHLFLDLKVGEHITNKSNLMIPQVNSNSSVSKQFDKRRLVQHERKQTLKFQCNVLGRKYQGTLGENKLRTHFIYDPKHKLVFCDLPKVGSTFLKQILHIVTGHKNVRNPFLITGDEAHGIPFQTFNNLNFDKIFDILVNYIKFMFVRDPYSRILSAYVDKLFIPNFVFWDNVGRLIINKHRKNPDKQSKTCGHNVYFHEFVKHIVTSETEKKFRNPHWYPMYEGCRPCHIDYDFIGKMETFKEDVRQLLKFTNLSHFVDVSSMDSQNDDEAVSLSINRAFEVAQSRKSCLTLPQSLERAWKVLQIRGVISYKSKFPYKEIKENSKITKREFTEILLHELNKFPMDKKSKRDIRQEVMFKAYQSVSKKDFDHFMKIFLPDFTLFGYDQSLPKSSFNNNIKWDPFELKL